jgi:hypothetical protein
MVGLSYDIKYKNSMKIHIKIWVIGFGLIVVCKFKLLINIWFDSLICILTSV